MVSATSSKISLVGAQESINSVFFLKNDSVFARKQGDFIAGYESLQNTVYGTNGPSLAKGSSYNTAIGYQSLYDSTENQEYNVVVGNGAAYDAVCSKSVVIGTKSIQSTDRRNYNEVINIGSFSDIRDTVDSVHIGNQIKSSKDNSSKNVIIGHKNTVHSINSILIGVENSNAANNSIIIGKNVKNTGTNSLLIYPKDSEGRSTNFLNDKDDYVNIFGIITGSNNKLNIGQSIDFSDDVHFNSSIIVDDSLDIKSNVNVQNNMTVANTFNVLSNNTEHLVVASNSYFHRDLFIDSNVHVNNGIYASNLSVRNNIYASNNIYANNILSVGNTIYMDDSNLTDILNEHENQIARIYNIYNQVTGNEDKITSLSISNLQLTTLSNNFYALSNDLISQIISNSSGTSTADLSAIQEDITNLQTFDDLITFKIEDDITQKFDDLFRRLTNPDPGSEFNLNIVRDSVANFPTFDGSYSSMSETMLFTLPTQPTINVTLIYPNDIWDDVVNDVEQYNITETNGLKTPGAILHESNIFKTRTFFDDKVLFNDSVSFDCNVFIKGAIKSYGNYVTINDNLLIYDALHVGDFIQTNATKVDRSFNNYVKIFKSLTFSNDWEIYTDTSSTSNLVFDGTNSESLVSFNNKIKANDTVLCYSNIAFSNDWNIFTRENENNPILKDLVFKGTAPNTVGVETSFTDFITGQLNFTGQHRCTFDHDSNNIIPGFIVSSTGIYSDLDDVDNIHIDDAIPIVSLSKSAYDKKAFGVISEFEDKVFPNDDNRRCFQIGTLRFKTDKKKKSKKLIVNSVGEGGIWVCNQNGNIYNGDLIVTSDRPGYGMKQNDDIIRNYTVAKSTCDAFFEKNDKLFIGCVYKM